MPQPHRSWYSKVCVPEVQWLRLLGSNLVEHRQVPDRDVAHTPVCLVWSKFCRCRARAAVALLVGETKLRQSCGFSARGHMIFVKVPCIGCRAIEVAVSKCSGGHTEHKKFGLRRAEFPFCIGVCEARPRGLLGRQYICEPFLLDNRVQRGTPLHRVTLNSPESALREGRFSVDR